MNTPNTDGEVDLNLAPILDCLTVLVAFLLASASFLSVSVLEASVAAEGTPADPNEKPPILYSLKLRDDGSFEGHWQKEAPTRFATLESVTERILARKSERPLLILKSDPAVHLQRIVEVMDDFRRRQPEVPLLLEP
jgi:biopolymer transport protein ExbD